MDKATAKYWRLVRDLLVDMSGDDDWMAADLDQIAQCGNIDDAPEETARSMYVEQNLTPALCGAPS